MSQLLETVKVQIKEARESAYLGKYQEAIRKFQTQIEQIQMQINKISNDQMLSQEWNKLLGELKDELELTETLNSYSRGNFGLPQSPQKPRVQECPEFQDEQRYPKLPFNQLPFVHHQRSPPKRDIIQISPPRQRQQNDADDAFFGGLRGGNVNQPNRGPANQHGDNYNNNNYNNNYQNRPKPVDKDPDVWEPPSKPSQKKKPTQKVAPKADNNPFKQNNKGDYEKPWLKNAKGQQPNNKKPVDPNQKKSFHDHVYPDGRGPDSDLIQMLEREMLDLTPNVKFEDIAELEQAKEVLKEAVLLPILCPEFFTGIRRPLRGVMLFGPPGTGKTMLAKAVATIGKTTFFNVSASSLASKWKGESEKLVRLLFEMAKYYSPSTIFFDEIDALGGKRGDNDGDATRKVKTEMLIQMDGVSTTQPGEERKTIMCLAATNRPWDLDEALIRRLERRIYIPLPSTIGRKVMFDICITEIKLGEIDWDKLVQSTEGYSGADIANLCRDAAMFPMRRKLKEEGGFEKFKEKGLEVKEIPLEMRDFEEALKNIKRSVANEYLKEYEKWMQEFGSA